MSVSIDEIVDRAVSEYRLAIETDPRATEQLARKCAAQIQKDAMRSVIEAIAPLLAAQPAKFANAGDSEATFIADAERLNCPTCGGSGHIDDARAAHPNCGAYPGDGSMCKGACRVERESPAAAPTKENALLKYADRIEKAEPYLRNSKITKWAKDIVADMREEAAQPVAQTGVPEGWQLVPTELSDDMRDALTLSISLSQFPSDTWEAMLASAPTPEVKP